MPSVFAKLNLKDQDAILVLDAPETFEAEIRALKGVSVLRNAKKADRIVFAIAFVTRQDELDSVSRLLASKAEGDALLWFAYPKGTSKRYRCEFNRDSGWDMIRSCGFDSVHQIAIDEDWSALRFRRTEYIGSTASSPARRR